MIYIVQQSENDSDRTSFTKASCGELECEVILDTDIKDTLTKLAEEDHIFIAAGVMVQDPDMLSDYQGKLTSFGFSDEKISAFDNNCHGYLPSVVSIPKAVFNARYFGEADSVSDLLNELAVFEIKPCTKYDMLFIPTISNSVDFNEALYNRAVFVDLNNCFPSTPLPNGINAVNYAIMYDRIQEIAAEVSDDFCDLVTMNVMYSAGPEYVVQNVIEMRRELRSLHTLVSKIFDTLEPSHQD